MIDVLYKNLVVRLIEEREFKKTNKCFYNKLTLMITKLADQCLSWLSSSYVNYKKNMEEEYNKRQIVSAFNQILKGEVDDIHSMDPTIEKKASEYNQTILRKAEQEKEKRIVAAFDEVFKGEIDEINAVDPAIETMADEYNQFKLKLAQHEEQRHATEIKDSCALTASEELEDDAVRDDHEKNNHWVRKASTQAKKMLRENLGKLWHSPKLDEKTKDKWGRAAYYGVFWGGKSFDASFQKLEEGDLTAAAKHAVHGVALPIIGATTTLVHWMGTR